MSTDILKLTNHIGGSPREPSTKSYFDSIDPATNQVIAHVPASSAEDIDKAVQSAKSALDGEWGRFTSAMRADLCDAIAQGLEKRCAELAELESLDTGKPLSLAQRIDIPRAISNFRFFAGAGRHQHTGCHEMSDALNYTRREPLGVVGLITPWNLPLYLLSWKTAPALVTGNAIIAKPSELTPITASVLAEIITEVGGPPGCFNLVHGTGPDVGSPLVDHPDVGGISFTGGTQTGALVAQSASKHFKKLSLELGGKNPTIVFPDCDFDKAVEGAVRAAFTNQGQVCLCGSRIFIHETIYDDFTKAMVEKTKALTAGDPRNLNTKTGALISQQHLEKVASYVAIAKEEGGHIRIGGSRSSLDSPFDQGAFFEPTLIDNLPPSSRVSTEEIFGPVATLHPFKTEAEVVALANDVRYGLAASVWTTDLRRAHRVSALLDTGMVWVNTWLKRDLRVPFGGAKDSGMGREGGWNSLNFFTQEKNVCISFE